MAVCTHATRVISFTGEASQKAREPRVHSISFVSPLTSFAAAAEYLTQGSEVVVL
jgi:hypothetical protein